MADAQTATRSESQSVVDLLGGRRRLGMRPGSEIDYVALVRNGMPYPAFESVLAKLKLPMTELGRTLGLSARSLQRRKRSNRLSKSESEVVLRLAHVVARAGHVLGAADAALEWLETPNRALRGDKPIELLDTEIGAKRVLDVLGRIEYGVYT